MRLGGREGKEADEGSIMSQISLAILNGTAVFFLGGVW